MFFINTVKVEWLEDDPRKMKLLESVSFVDDTEKVWVAPAGSIIDGASIPRFFWRVIGSPFIGMYRRASVIHDVYCVTRSELYEEVHQMFDNAMRADGVPDVKRIAMAEAVKKYGPRWDNKGHSLPAPSDEDLLNDYE